MAIDLTNADKQTATVLICVHCRNWQEQRARHGRQALVYACGGSAPTAPPGFIKPTVGALELRPAAANYMRHTLKPAPATQRYGCYSSVSP